MNIAYSGHIAPPTNQRGVAIITVMLMVTLATIAVTAMVTEQQLDIYRTGRRLTNVQLETLALAGENFAVQQLHLDHRRAGRSDSDSFEDDWATPTPSYPIKGATISGCIVDMQGHFNVNNLVDETGKLNTEQHDMFVRLLQTLNIDAVKVAAVVDWLDADVDIHNADGAEDDYYTQRTPPYLAANRRFASISELKLVKGFNEPGDSKDYEVLLPHISALPAPTTINVNTATPAIIQSLAGFVDSTTAQELSRWDDERWEHYPKCPPFGEAGSTGTDTIGKDDFYATIEDFVTEINSGRTQEGDIKFENTDLISVRSSYYETNVLVELDSVRVAQRSLLQRDEDGTITLLLRARGDNLLQISGQ